MLDQMQEHIKIQPVLIMTYFKRRISTAKHVVLLPTGILLSVLTALATLATTLAPVTVDACQSGTRQPAASQPAGRFQPAWSPQRSQTGSSSTPGSSSRRSFGGPSSGASTLGNGPSTRTASARGFSDPRGPVVNPSSFSTDSRRRDVSQSSFNQPVEFPQGHFDSPTRWGDLWGNLVPPAKWMGRITSRIPARPIADSKSGSASTASAVATDDQGPIRQVSARTTSQQREGFTPRTVDQNFVYAVQLARDGKTRQAESLATKAFENEPDNAELAIRYIDTMVTIAEFAKTGNSSLNKAIRTAARIQTSKLANGKGNADLSFKFLQSLRELGKAVTRQYPKQGAKLLIAEGDIASNLLKNAEFPVAAQQGLAESFFNHAWGLAIKSSSNDVTASLNRAFELGFTGFDRALTEPAFQRLETAGDISLLVNMHRSKKVSQVKDWAKRELAEFQPYVFSVDAKHVADGTRISESSFRGNILVVDFWATWCEPCRRQLPHLMRLKSEYQRKGVQLLGVSFDNVGKPREAGPVVRRFIKTNKLQYANVLGNRKIRAANPLVRSVPSTAFVDGRGRVRLVLTGYHDYHVLETITDLLLEEASIGQRANSGGEPKSTQQPRSQFEQRFRTSTSASTRG